MEQFFAEIDESGNVLNVIVADFGHIASLPNSASYIETFFDANGDFEKRFNYAEIGGWFDILANAFIGLQPYSSWVLNQFTWRWEAPVPMPQDDKLYVWDEPSLSWVEITQPTET